jgi:hypothetical protein
MFPNRARFSNRGGETKRPRRGSLEEKDGGALGLTAPMATL